MKRTETNQNPTEAGAMEEADAGAGDTTTDPPLLLSRMTESPREDSITTFKSEFSKLL